LKEEYKTKMKKIAVVQVRGGVGMSKKVKDSLGFLRLRKKNSCVILDQDPRYTGALVKLKDFVTWGEIDTETFRVLFEKRGRMAGNKKLTEEYLKQKTNKNYEQFSKEFMEGKVKLKEVPGIKTYFRLTPPRGGFEKQGIKKQYSMGGALGYRKNGINELLRRMV